VQELQAKLKYIVLDARELKEYQYQSLEERYLCWFNKFDNNKVIKKIETKISH
jgi:hypothetical protein